jgi:hypothetical protein
LVYLPIFYFLILTCFIKCSISAGVAHTEFRYAPDPLLSPLFLLRFSFSVFYKARQRLGDKLEFVDFDPVVGQKVLYREESKVRSIRDHQIERIPRLLYSNDVQSKWKSFADEP